MEIEQLDLVKIAINGALPKKIKSHLLMANTQAFTDLLTLPIVSNEDI